MLIGRNISSVLFFTVMVGCVVLDASRATHIFPALVLVIATVFTLIVLARDVWGLFHGPADLSLQLYAVIVDVWLVGILPVTLYPFLGGKVWCRYWCPLAKLMQFASKIFTRADVSKFHIHANDKCIACYECSLLWPKLGLIKASQDSP